jgi:putative membrane protein
VEFIAVLSFPQTNVGGYVNTSLDLVFNALGAIAAVIFIQLVKYKKVL